MGLESLLATVGIIFILIFSSVVAEPATLAFTDCFGGDDSYKLQISTVYGQTLSDRYLNLTILGSTPIEVFSASNDTDPVASACLLSSFSHFQCCIPGCGFTDHADSLPSYPLLVHRPAHV